MKDHIEENHFLIMKKHLRAMHKELGEMYKYPKCCIRQFCDEQELGIPSAQHREQSFNQKLPREIQYVPCDKCFIKMLNKKT